MGEGATQLYDSDFFAWTQVQAKKLRRLAETRPNLPLDLGLIAEEIEDLGMSERSAVFSLVRLIIQHILFVVHSPAPEQRRHWLDEVDEFRNQIEDKLTPTIRRDVETEFDVIYSRARRNVARKMRRYGEEALPPGFPRRAPSRSSRSSATGNRPQIARLGSPCGSRIDSNSCIHS